ncbi:acylphosphatase [Streptomyces sp. NPDC048639]|uniref:acylphosphatase n=1 Tax=Streptomyces sp. NPDC048639 TaxID=3365581 RepID=UPI0037193EE5
MIRKHVVVSGDVQGVYFRDTCRRTALERRVAGWVRNRPDGTVEAVFEGDPDAVERMVAWAHEGPPAAVADKVSVRDEQPEGLTGYEIRPTPY